MNTLKLKNTEKNRKARTEIMKDFKKAIKKYEILVHVTRVLNTLSIIALLYSLSKIVSVGLSDSLSLIVITSLASIITYVLKLRFTGTLEANISSKEVFLEMFVENGITESVE